MDTGGTVTLDLTESELSTMDFNDIAHDVTVLYNAVRAEQQFSPEFVADVSEDVLNLGGALTQLAADHPEHGTVISDLLEKVEKSREAVIRQAPQEIVKEEPMNRLQFIQDRLQESTETVDEETMQEADEMRQQLEDMTDDELIDVALEAGVLEPDVEEDDDDDELDAEVTVQDLLDYIEELEVANEEGAELVTELAEHLEEAEDVDDIKLKYEASLNIIQETVSRYQLLQEAVGGEEKAEEIMEAYIQALENASDVTEGKDDKGQITEDDAAVADVEALLNQDDPEADAEMARYVELAEAACGLN